MMRPRILIAVGLSALCLSGSAFAHVDIGISLGIPAPVYVAPPVVYEEAPPPPPVVYDGPPVIYTPGAIVYGDGYPVWRGHRRGWRHWKRDEDHRRWEYRRNHEGDDDH